MRKKLLALNIVLAVLAAAAAYKAAEEWTVQKKQTEAVRSARVKPARVAPVVVPPGPAPVTAGAYSDIAAKMLFSQERNPTVVVVAPAAPPPKPMPALPYLHGVMGLPNGMLALMSLKNGGTNVGVGVGDKIGEFQIASLTSDEISFKWEDKTVTKSVSEMIYHAQEEAPAPAPAASAAMAANGSAPAAASASGGPAKAGADTGDASGIKTCSAGDTSPGGTIADGYRKVLRPTPFGNSCFWEPVK